LYTPQRGFFEAGKLEGEGAFKPAAQTNQPNYALILLDQWWHFNHLFSVASPKNAQEKAAESGWPFAPP
jgi:hypothetical protein